MNHIPSPPMDIFYVTYPKDHQWFRLSLACLKKNLTGYDRIHVVTPSGLEDVEGITLHHVPDWPGRGYFWQQWIKLTADQYTDAQHIVFIDSDVFVAEPMDLSECMDASNARPYWMWAWYTDLSADVPWQAATEAALKMVVPREFMQAFPFIIHRDTLADTREAIAAAHGDAEAYIRSAGSFSEFNAMGAVEDRSGMGRYTFIDRNREAWPPGVRKMRHFWSHAPLVDHLPVINAFLTGDPPMGIRYTNMGIAVIEGDTHISKWVDQAGRLDCDGGLLPRVVRQIKRGDVVVDVGAFIGDHTHAYAVATRGVDTGRVLAFEPNPLPFYALTVNMRGHGHVECINKALGAQPGTASFVQSDNVGASHLIEGTEVVVTTLDSYALDRCDLIKIDAEGCELGILQGAAETIDRCQPILVLEMNAGALARNGVSYDQIANWLLEHGYTVVDILGSKAQHDIICAPR